MKINKIQSIKELEDVDLELILLDVENLFYFVLF